MYGIYHIYHNQSLIYVGKTTDFYIRLKNHKALQPWGNEITHVELAECQNKIDMDLYEKYYINKLRPKYNIAMVYGEFPTFKIEELIFKRVGFLEFINLNKSKTTNTKVKVNIYEKRSNEINELIKKHTRIHEGEIIDFLNSQTNLYYWYNSLNKKITFLEVKNAEIFKDYLKGIKNGDCELVDGNYEFYFKNSEEMFREAKQRCVSLVLTYYVIYARKISDGFVCVTLTSGAKLNMETKDVTLFVDKSVLDRYFSKYFSY